MQTAEYPEIPPDVFEALVATWTEILVADYKRRHSDRAMMPADSESEGEGEG